VHTTLSRAKQSTENCVHAGCQRTSQKIKLSIWDSRAFDMLFQSTRAVLQCVVTGKTWVNYITSPKKGLGHGNTHHLFSADIKSNTISWEKQTIFWDHKDVLLGDNATTQLIVVHCCCIKTSLWWQHQAPYDQLDFSLGGYGPPSLQSWSHDLLQVPIWSKLSSGYTCLTKIFSVLGYKLWYHSGTNGEIVNGD